MGCRLQLARSPRVRRRDRTLSDQAAYCERDADIYRNVWSGFFHEHLVPEHDLYIASPPCQTFSMAGKGEGRKALDDVLGLIDEQAFVSGYRLERLTNERDLDPRTALVLTPLAHIYHHRPRLVALEQVPEVLPVWHAYAAVLRSFGYSVWTGIMRAEQYGVPQTRKRAILMARLDGKVQPPTPTHSRYYSTDPAAWIRASRNG